MKKLKRTLFVCIFAFISVSVFAHGKNDVETKQATNFESWQETFDLEGKKKGKYNIMITVTDFGGNQVVEGPYNIYIDPKSDLPICSITNPSSNRYVNGNLSIIGTCVDDDGVEYVDVYLDGDKDNSIRAEGKEFWSCFVDTSELEEGEHTITAIGTDINGLTGEAFTMTWKLDRRQPVTTVQNYGMGTLVSGNTNLKGIIEDGNGISSLEYSTDGGVKFSDAKIKKNKKAGNWTFEIPLNTKKLPDGPAVIWLKAIDSAGSEGIYSFLYFVDNKSPDIKIVTPKVSESKSGIFSVAGYVKDSIGIEKLSWTFGKSSGDLEVFQGNQYWSVELDATNIKAKSEKFVITALDKAGNVTSESRTIYLNQKISAPKAIITEPNRSNTFDSLGELVLRGIAIGENPIQYIKYKLDIGEEQTQETTGAFCITLSNAASLSKGRHTISVIPVDITGAEGEASVVRFDVKSPSSYSADIAETELKLDTPTLSAWVQNTIKIAGTVVDKVGIQSVEYSIDGSSSWTPFTLTSRTAESATFSEEVNIENFKDGIIRVDVRSYNNNSQMAVVHSAAYKDTTPPEVNVVLPLATESVYGSTLMAFTAHDINGIDKIYYIAPDDKTGTKIEVENADLITTYVGTKEKPIGENMAFEFVDKAGNVTRLNSWDFNIDPESDYPKAEIHLPTENQVITRDFTISGVVYDDDGPATVWYKIDNSPAMQLPDPGTSFSINVPISSMTDNEHTITVYAVDVNGVKGNEVQRKFLVSLEEPVAEVTSPTIDMSSNSFIEIKGTASDANGVAKVQVSLDNGNSYNDASGTDNWTYAIDTRAIPDGSQIVFVKTTDNYGITGLASSLITIDNTSPVLSLELPLDDSTTSGNVFFSGYSYDNVGVTDMYITIRSLEQKAVSKELSNIKIVPDRIIAKTVDISSLQDGMYNVEVTSQDKAGNSTKVSRNILLDTKNAVASVDIFYPFPGEAKQGVFKIYGKAQAEKQIASLTLYVDGQNMGSCEPQDSGFFSFEITPEMLAEGEHKYRVDASFADSENVSSRIQSVIYTPTGPWITIDNFTYGDFAIDRPYIRGSAGYSLSEEEKEIQKAKSSTKAQKQAIKDKEIDYIELSLNNGKTFTRLSKSSKWKYRIENQDIEEGYHFLLVKATMKNGETAITRTIVQVDNTKPYVRLISPGNGGRYNQELKFSGLSQDEVGLQDVELALRKGDKSTYGVPKFIQGLHFDFHFWGATLFDLGLGLSFFDDNVKLQFHWGQFTQAQREIFTPTKMRYGGNVVGLKLLANVATLPFGSFFGRDWDWLSASFALGADFSYFSQTSSGKGQIVSALLLQIEFPRVTIDKWKYFRTFSIYTEGSLWFTPTDVTSTQTSFVSIRPQIAVGLRWNVF